MRNTASPVTGHRSPERVALLLSTFDASLDLKIVLELGGAIADANRTAVECLDADAAVLDGRPLWEAPAVQRQPDFALWLRGAVELAAASNASPASPHLAATLVQLQRANGSEVCFDVTLRRVETPMSADAYLLIEGRDVTERVRAEQTLLARKRRLRLLTDNMRELLFMMRVEAPGVFRCESVNPAYLAATGLREEDVVGRLLEEVIPPDSLQQSRLQYEQVIASGEPTTYLEDVTLPGGRLVVETRLTPVRDSQGVVTHLLGLARDVTSERSAHLAVTEAATRLRAVLDAGLDAFVIVRAVRDEAGEITDFTIVDANVRAAAMAAGSPSTLSGMSLLSAFPHSRGTGLWEHCVTVVATRRPLEVTQYAPLPNSLGRWVLRQIVPIGDGVAVSSRDITARHLERVALEASEARHRELFESNGAIQLLADAEDSRIIDVNPAAEAFYGWSRETMRTMLLTDLESTTMDEWKALGRAIADGTGYRRLREHRVANRERRQVEASAAMVRAGGRRVVHLIVQDVSDRVRSADQLGESEARFRAVISAMREGVVIHDATGIILAFNPSAERILGLSAAQLLGTEPIARDWEAMYEDGKPWPTRQHPAMLALESGVSQPRSIMGVRRGDGAYTWLSVTAAPLLREGQTTPHGSVAVFSDVTDERVAQDRLRQAQKLEAVGQLAGGIAHDFNNLLTVIRGAAGFLADSVEPTSPLMEDVQAIERATERAEELTRSLLAVGRRQMLQRSRMDLRELLREQLATVRDSVPQSITVRLELDDEPVTALLDRTRVIDALRALVTNAVDAMSEGGVMTLAAEVTTRRRGLDVGGDAAERRYVVLRVSDTGIGMPEEVQARLFEPFFSTQPFGTGRGMELASVHGMVAQSNGFIEIDSEPGSGTTLRLLFPEASPALDERRPKTPAVSLAIGRRILIVDDDPMLRDLARRMLERLGHSVLVAESGAQALELLAAHGDDVALMLTDVTMPGMSGMELIEHVRQRMPALPIAVMSGFALNSSVRDELALQSLPFVAKPFTATELSAALDRALGVTKA